MIKVGLTGGIGAGKSYVAKLLSERGIPTYDSDSMAKMIMDTSPAIQAGLKRVVGDCVVANGVIDKSKLAAFVFADSNNAAKINALVHPLVREHFECWAEREKNSVVCLESAILFESGFEDCVDKVVVVHASDSIRTERVMLRSGLTEGQVKERMNLQMSQAEKCARADFLIDNNGSEEDLTGQIDKLIEKFIELC